MYNLEELVVIRAALDVLTIQGQSASKMVDLQNKTDQYIKDLKQGPPQEN
jgi:hypothetical protein